MTPPTIDQSVIERLSALLEAATLDRWKYEPIYRGGQLVRNSIVADGREIAYDVNDARDADLIVAMKNALPAILASLSPSPIAGKDVTRAFVSLCEVLSIPATACAHLEASDRQRDAVIAAYIQGASDVHANWQEDRDPDFTEAAHDYAASLTPPAECVATPGEVTAVGLLIADLEADADRWMMGDMDRDNEEAGHLSHAAATLLTQMEAREQAKDARIAALEKALEPFARARVENRVARDDACMALGVSGLILGDIRTARALLNPTPTEER